MDIAKWSVQHLRYTLFPDPVENKTIEPDAWWQVMIGAPPESFRLQPRAQIYEGQAAWGSGTLLLHIETLRADWRLLPPENVDTVEVAKLGTIPIIGSFADNVATFTGDVRRWLASADVPRALRIAFGAQLISPVPDTAEGYAFLQGYLPAVTLDVTGSSDFDYRINRPRTEQFGGRPVRVNRLSRWNVIRAVQHGLQLTFALGMMPGRASITHAATVDLDINTAPEEGLIFTPTQQADMFVRLTELAQEIAEKGDLP